MDKKTTEFILTEDDRMKYEIAQEIGLGEKVAQVGWKGLTSKESGKIGGLMAAKKSKQKK